MKNLLYLIILFCWIPSQTQTLDGVYKFEENDVHHIWVFADGYTSQTTFKDDKYLQTRGGIFELVDNKIITLMEFSDKTPEEISKSIFYPISFTEKGFIDELERHWIKQSSDKQGLDGVWKISGRQQNGEFVKINHSGTRKTLKILKDGYFQWIAIEPDQKKFFGTGGGLYEFENGKYTEEILFFSKDDSRVGAKLSFEGEIIDGDWHHKGKSSKGDPIHEVWILVNKD